MSNEIPAGTRTGHSWFGRIVSLLLKIVLPIVVLTAAGLGAKQMLETAPKAPRRHRARMPKLVEVTTLNPSAQTIELEAMGKVIPARSVELKPEVAGRVTWIARTLEPGARFKAGEPLLKIDRRDFELAVTQRQSEVDQAGAAVIEARYSLTKARTDLKLEMGNQAVALKEYEVLNEQINENNAELVLRKPQLQAARGAVEAAEAAIKSAEASLLAARARLAEAQLDLKRTTVLAPFNMIVKNKRVDVGDMVGTNTALIELIGSDTFWVKLAVPQNDLQWIDIPETPDSPGSSVRVYVGTPGDTSQYREGRVIRRLPEVEEPGRMAQLLTAIDDPLGLSGAAKGTTPLLLGSYVRAKVMGRNIQSALAVPRDLIRNGNQIWVMTDQGKLDIRRVEIIYRGRQVILVRDHIYPRDRLIVTDLATPVQGMPLRMKQAQSETSGGPVPKRAKP